MTKVWYALLFILIVGLSFYSKAYYIQMAESAFTLNDYLENPQKYGGYKGQHFGKFISISQDNFYYDLGDLDIKVIGSGVRNPIYGETVIFVNHRTDGIIELVDYHNYNYNYLLYFFSFIALVIFLILFFREWRLTLRGGCLFENKSS